MLVAIENVFLKIVSALFLFGVVSSFQAQTNLNNECESSSRPELVATCSKIKTKKIVANANDEAKSATLKISRI
jgi:hypothetical protein